MTYQEEIDRLVLALEEVKRCQGVYFPVYDWREASYHGHGVLKIAVQQIEEAIMKLRQLQIYDERMAAAHYANYKRFHGGPDAYALTKWCSQ